MNEQRESLSTLIDNFESTDLDQSLLNDVLADVNQKNTLRRYQLIGDVLRKDIPERIDLDFAAKVRSEIDHESTFQVKSSVQQETQQKSSWFWSVLFKPVAGLAVAATVAVVAVSSIQLQTTSDSPSDQLANANTSSAKVEHLASIPVVGRGAAQVSVNGQSSATPVGMNWKIKRNEPAIQQKLNTYLINHNEYSNSMHGIIPQSRVVGFDAQK